MLTIHPDWTAGQIAEAVGCSRQHLYKLRRFRQARELLRKGRLEVRRGFRQTGRADQVDAIHWDDPMDE
jgi:hypothetical protein